MRSPCALTALARPLAAVALCASLPALAWPVDFYGSLTRSNPQASVRPPCEPRPTAINKNEPPLYISTGISNLGTFFNNSVRCVVPPQDGHFSFDFGGGDTLFGTFESAGGDPTGIEDLFTTVGDYRVTGGTGRFGGVTGGAFMDHGYLDRRHPETGNWVSVFHGSLVPEPATWASMLAGLAGVAMSMRRGRATAAGGAAKGVA